MSNPIILSDEDEDDQKTPPPSLPKKPRTGPDPIPTIFLIDDDPTPKKSCPTTTNTTSPFCSFSSLTSTPSVVPETPLSDLSIVKCTALNSNPGDRVSDTEDPKLSGSGRLISLDSENDEPEIGFGMESWREYTVDAGDPEEIRWSSGILSSEDAHGDANGTDMPEDGFTHRTFAEGNFEVVDEYPEKENLSMEPMCNNNIKGKRKTKTDSDNKGKVAGRKKMSKEERTRLMEEKKQQKEQEKLQKAALKAQAAQLKKMEKEKQKWEKGKFALKSIVTEFDTKVVEQGSIGGHLLTRFADKGLTYRITSNPIERSIVWTMAVPEHLSELSSEETEIRYVLLIHEAKEFCNLVADESLLDHVSRIQNHYPSYTVCFLTNRLMAYINKREREQYKNLENDDGWKRPPIEEVLAKLTTHFFRVHYRHCTDEAELAEHVVGLTCSLASCQFRKKLTRLSVNANGCLVPKDFVDKSLIKKSPWLKALVAIPKVQPRFAIAIWKKYPTMKSLLTVYMDRSKSVHEKEFLLQDLTVEGLVGGERRVGQVCSKRVYRILMAQSGSIKTDDVEDGADFFRT